MPIPVIITHSRSQSKVLCLKIKFDLLEFIKHIKIYREISNSLKRFYNRRNKKYVPIIIN